VRWHCITVSNTRVESGLQQTQLTQDVNLNITVVDLSIINFHGKSSGSVVVKSMSRKSSMKRHPSMISGSAKSGGVPENGTMSDHTTQAGSCHARWNQSCHLQGWRQIYASFEETAAEATASSVFPPAPTTPAAVGVDPARTA
jgi:hypothetical protein